MITFEQVLDCVLEEAEIRLDNAVNGPAFERAKQKYALEQASRPRRPKKPRNKRGHWVFVEDRCNDYYDDDDDDDIIYYRPRRRSCRSGNYRRNKSNRRRKYYYYDDD